MFKKYNFKGLALASALCSSALLPIANASQFFDPLDGQFDASKYLSENAYGFLPVPIIITDPAVDGGLGAIGLFFHEEEEDRDKRLEAMRSSDNAAMHLMPPSVSAAVGAYTGNGSYFVGGGHVGFFKKGAIRYMGGGGYGDINLDFFGIGNIELSKPLEINTKATAIMQNLKFQVGKSRFFVGPAQRYINSQIKPSNLGEFLPDIFPPEWAEELTRLLTTDVTLSALGLAMEYDSRDNFFSPKSGLRYQLDYYWYNDRIGSDIDYQLVEFSGLHYFKLAKNWRAGVRLDFDYADADDLLPPYATPFINMRGIPAMRYQGNAIGITELEVVYQVNPRWQINVFTGVGKASNELSDLMDESSRVAKGAGFRYLIARRYGFDMGVDIAKGPEDTVFYIQAGSAW